MARTKSFNENMTDLVEAVSDYRSAAVRIRAKYAALAEEEIARGRGRLLDLMFVKYHKSGPSEIANTTGISRTTVIRWRKEFLSILDKCDPPLESLIEDAKLDEAEAEEQVTATGFEFGMDRSRESNSNVHWARCSGDEDKVYFPVGDFFCEGTDPDEAEQNPISQPEWLTDDVMKQAEAATGERIPYAPWR